MKIKAKATRSYYVTETSIDLPAQVQDVDELVRELRANGKVTIIYNGGNVQGLSVEQKTPVPDAVDDRVRKLVRLSSEKI